MMMVHTVVSRTFRTALLVHNMMFNRPSSQHTFIFHSCRTMRVFSFLSVIVCEARKMTAAIAAQKLNF
jgi:hypothetical protein